MMRLQSGLEFKPPLRAEPEIQTYAIELCCNKQCVSLQVHERLQIRL